MVSLLPERVFGCQVCPNELTLDTANQFPVMTCLDLLCMIPIFSVLNILFDRFNVAYVSFLKWEIKPEYV